MDDDTLSVVSAKLMNDINSIKPSDITELKGMRNATDTARLVMDALQILFKGPMNKVELGELNMLKMKTPFI